MSWSDQLFSPSDCRSSYPIHVPQVTDGENPRNHASVKSFVVPVLPPSGWCNCDAATPVPPETTACSSCIMVRAVSTEITSVTPGVALSSGIAVLADEGWAVVVPGRGTYAADKLPG